MRRRLTLLSFISITTLLLMTTKSEAQDFKLSFDHNAIQVKDLTESSNFYLNILGLEEIENKTEKSHIRWFSMGGDTSIHVIENKLHKVPDVKGVHFALRANDLDAFIAHLKKNNIYFESWPGEPKVTNSRPDGIRQVYLQDPNGYWIEVNGE
ncbi:VOC family protein [Galbibacter sp. EGI 63066]|uniref:VOC family protein n=1 Tax=Galbibacter sp. EGI 63066 TaxID=2993559 RepID=UPI002248B4E7|nr:VOC family protein [Galbibacter sp. EGI 63066]MCX2679234.1 VOC family protein [Galbibacter sp. EGI 63066]